MNFQDGARYVPHYNIPPYPWLEKAYPRAATVAAAGLEASEGCPSAPLASLQESLRHPPGLVYIEFLSNSNVA